MNILIATDIDGTLTDHPHSIPQDVISYLESLSAKGIELLFVTGRPYHRSFPSLKDLKFPFYLAVYNGSLIFQMPEQEIVHREYLSSDILKHLTDLCIGEPTDVVVYGGFEHQDVCYYRPEHFSKELLDYLKYRCEKLDEIWKPVATFDDLPIGNFPSAKCFGTKEALLNLKQKMEHSLEVYVPVIADTLGPYFLAQVTKKGIHKGRAIESVKAMNPLKNYKVIACGDDFNDLEMLQDADVSVVMETAPKELLLLADVIAPAAKHHGIIAGINKALEKILT